METLINLIVSAVITYLTPKIFEWATPRITSAFKNSMRWLQGKNRQINLETAPHGLNQNEPSKWYHLCFIVIGAIFSLASLNLFFVIMPGLYRHEVDESMAQMLLLVDMVVPLCAGFASMLVKWKDKGSSFVLGLLSSCIGLFYVGANMFAHLAYYNVLSTIERVLGG